MLKKTPQQVMDEVHRYLGVKRGGGMTLSLVYESVLRLSNETNKGDIKNDK